ncbi:MAG: CPBP family intramembrane metalloprotease [Planctomycetaceae bacterium]|nr:CPBP family intramembrane metalloprotease [Planctomycetaceae bacterium]
MNASDSLPATTAGNSLARTSRLARKELREILRDRRTVITLVLMPLFVYPLLGVLLRKGLLSGLDPARKLQVQVCLEDQAAAVLFSDEMIRGERLLSMSESDEPPESTDTTQSALLLSGQEQDFEFSIYWCNPEHPEMTPERHVAEGLADLAVRLSVSESQMRRRSGIPYLNWQLLTRRGSALSDRAHREVVRRLNAINDFHVNRLLQSHGLSVVRPITVSNEKVESADGGTAASLVTFIPLVLVLMTMTGAVYPAIDLTAGERERGTMEILVAAPVSRMTLLAGKFVAVLTVALLTASVNLISMFATLFALGLEGTVLGNVGPTMVLQVIVLMVVFAAFFSAVLLSITSIARSFKEAQAYLIPLMLISLTPGVFSLMPDLKINGPLAVIPLVNTVLMGRDLLLGNVNILMFAVVLVSTVIYGTLALSLAARIFGSDAVLYRGGDSGGSLFQRPREISDTAPLPTALLTLAIVFSLFIVLGSLPSRLNTGLSNQLLAAGLTSVLLFIAIPTMFAAFSRIRWTTGFSVRSAGAASLAAAALLGLSLWPFVYELEVMLLTEQRLEFLKQLYESFELNLAAVPLWVKLFALAIAPAVCEEYFFRGFLQNSIRRRASAAVAVITAAVLFGFFHVIVKDALLFERLLPSTLMGFVLGIVFERTRSVLPGMLLHVLHNGLLVTVSAFEQQLAARGIGIAEHQHLPPALLLGALMPVVSAAFLLTRVSPRTE